MKAVSLAGMIALVAVPALAAPGEIPLHVSTQGLARPDSAILKFTISASGDSQAEAEAALKKEEARIRDELVKAGADPRQIDIGEAEDDMAVGAAAADLADSAAGAVGAAEAAASAAKEANAKAIAEAARDAVKGRKSEEQLDAEAAAAAAPGYAALRASVTVTLTDLDKLEAVRKLANDNENFEFVKPEYKTSDPQKARQRAIADAITKARADADAYAAAIGYRVVRITRVASDSQGINLNVNSAMQIVNLVAGARGDEELIYATTYAGADMDFMIAPK